MPTPQKRLVFFPNEMVTPEGVTIGSIYLIGLKGTRFPAAGGPPQIRIDGYHVAKPTEAGVYTLGKKEHVTYDGYINSIIPFGARLRLIDPWLLGYNGNRRPHAGEVEYLGNDNRWHLATGPNGDYTNAMFRSEQLLHNNPKRAEIVELVRNRFVDKDTKQLKNNIYKWNDFGRWGWNMRYDGRRTEKYVHTTPGDEEVTESNSKLKEMNKQKEIKLSPSHGCVHIKPTDRDRMESLGYLVEGAIFEVRKYTDKSWTSMR